MKNTFEKPTLYVSYKTVQKRFNSASKWSIAGTLLSLVLIVVGFNFMNWLSGQSSYSFGTMVESISIQQNKNVIAKLQSPFKQDYVMNETIPLSHNEGDWMFVYGERVGYEEPQILVSMEQAKLPIFGAIFSTPPKLWLSNMAESEYLALIVAMILLIWSSHIFRWTYTIVLSAGAFITLWHALHFAHWHNLLHLSNIGFYSIVILFLSAFVSLVNKHKQFQFVESFFAAGAWLIASTTIQTWMGWSDAWVLIMFVVALISPAIIAATISAYLLSKSFDASLTGGYSLWLLSILVITAQWIDKKAVQSKLNKLTNQVFTKSLVKNKGRVTLAELLKQ